MPLVCEFDTQSVRPAASPRHNTRDFIYFRPPFVAPPRLAHGLRALDVAKNANVRVKSSIPHCTNTWADCHIDAWDTTTLYRAISHIFALAPADIDFLTGEHMRKSNTPSSVRINFERPFVTPPHVVVFFNYIDLGNERNWRLHVSANAIDTKGFTLSVEGLGDTICHAVQTCWIAYPEDRQRIFSTSVHTMNCVMQPRHEWSKDIIFNGVAFLEKPSVFVALNFIDVDRKANLRINAYADSITQNGLVCHIDTFDDTVIHAAGVSIIAFI